MNTHDDARMEEPFSYNSTFPSHIQQGILSINPGHRLWPLWRQTMDLNPKSGSDVETDGTTYTPRGYSEIYYSHNKALWGEQDRLPKLVWKWENKERRLTWIFIAVRRWGWSEGFSAQPHMIMETSESNICSMGWQLRNWEPMVHFPFEGWQPGDPEGLKSEGCLLENSLLLGGRWLFCSIQASTEWMRPTHIMEGSLSTQISLI